MLFFSRVMDTLGRESESRKLDRETLQAPVSHYFRFSRRLGVSTGPPKHQVILIPCARSNTHCPIPSSGGESWKVEILMRTLGPLQATSRFVCILTFHTAYSRSTFQALDLAPIAAIITKVSRRWAPGWRRRYMRSSVRERRRRKQSFELGLIYGRWHRVVDGEERIIIDVQ